MNEAAIDRILQRLAILRGGTAVRAGDLAWDFSFPADLDDESSPTLSFPCRFTLEAGRVTGVHGGAPLGRVAPDQATAVAALNTDIATTLARETVTFPSSDALFRYLVDEMDGELDEDTVELPPPDEDGEPVFATIVPVAREPWVNLSIALDDDVDPDWLLEQNGLLTHVHVEAFEGSISLACAFPLALLTAQRLWELVGDLATFREQLLEELEGGEEEEEEG